MARYRVIEFAELDSTNRHARANLHDLADGDVIQATVQTDGHGRLRRRWISHVPGNLCVSIILKPTNARPADLPLANLSQLLSVCVCRALDTRGAAATLKWPNDVLVGGSKIAGLLAETVVRGAGEFMGMVLGLGSEPEPGCGKPGNHRPARDIACGVDRQGRGCGKLSATRC